MEEPYVKATVIVPNDFVGAVMEISQDKRGEFKTMDYLDTNRVLITYHIPLNEIIYDYFDRLKSATRGYASLDYELADYQASKLVKVDILLNGDAVDALSTTRSSPARMYAPAARTCWPSATAAISPARGNSWRRRRKARSA